MLRATTTITASSWTRGRTWGSTTCPWAWWWCRGSRSGTTRWGSRCCRTRSSRRSSPGCRGSRWARLGPPACPAPPGAHRAGWGRGGWAWWPAHSSASSSSSPPPSCLPSSCLLFSSWQGSLPPPPRFLTVTVYLSPAILNHEWEPICCASVRIVINNACFIPHYTEWVDRAGSGKIRFIRAYPGRCPQRPGWHLQRIAKCNPGVISDEAGVLRGYRCICFTSS